MKKTLSIFPLLLIYFGVNAQLEQGNVSLGGSFSFSTRNIYDDNPSGDVNINSNGFSFRPRIGYLVSDRAIFGLGFEVYTHSNDIQENSLTRKYNTTSFSVEPFYRYYFSVGDKFGLFLHSAVSYGFSKTKNSETNDLGTSETAITGRRFGLGVWPGINYFINNKWAVEAGFGGIGYSIAKNKSDGETSDAESKMNGFHANFGISSFSLGVKFFLDRQ